MPVWKRPRRGSAVVVSEVRSLAQRSAAAAQEIKSLISASGRQVSEGVRLVGDTGTVLIHIVSEIVGINALLTETGGSIQAQSTGLGEVRAAVTQMDQVTQQNAAMVEQATAAMQSLVGQAEELAHTAGQFQIVDGGGHAAGVRHVRQAARIAA